MPRAASNSPFPTNKAADPAPLVRPACVRSLKGDRAFQRLRKGRSGHAKFLSTRYLPTRHSEVRVGVVVSKKVGNAVTRNRVRRRLREALKALLQERTSPVVYGGCVSCDLVVITRPEAADADFWQLKDALAKALSKSGLLT